MAKVQGKLCGGYVSWDGQSYEKGYGPKDGGLVLRKRVTKELYVRVPFGTDVSDCGPGTTTLIEALKEKAGVRKNVKVSECWEA
jgi:hypothetical protein